MHRRDIRGWFPQRNEDVLARLIEEHNVRTAVEIGSFLGASAAFFAEKCDHVTCIDPFVIWDDFINDAQPIGDLQSNFFSQFWGNMHALGIAHKVTPVILTGEEAHDALPALRADLVYIDAAHDYDSVRRDILTWMERTNTIICGDDFSPHWQGVRDAVTELMPDAQVEGDSLWYKVLG